MRIAKQITHRVAICATLAAWSLAYPATVPAQDSSTVNHGGKMVRVTLVLAERDIKGAPFVKRSASRQNVDLIILRNDDVTPEAVARSVGSLSSAIRSHGIEAPRNAMVRTRSASPVTLDKRNRMHYAALIQRLRNSPLRAVPGVGQARTVDFFVLTSPSP